MTGVTEQACSLWLTPISTMGRGPTGPQLHRRAGHGRQGRPGGSGFSKVEGALQHGQAAALIHASDGAADGIRKLDAVVGQRGGNSGESPVFPIVTVLASEQLDLALGRSNVIHAALLAGPASKTFLSRCPLMVRYRMADADKTADAAR